ncbi:DNA repair protein RecO [Chloroflexota bacterium]
MSKPRSYQTEAIIIRKTKLGEADRILTFYTPSLGKIQGVAKGVRRPKSKLAGHLELITHSLVSLARGRNLDTVTGSQTINGFFKIKNDLWLTSCALYAGELVNQFTAEDIENRSLFDLLLATLKRLEEGGNVELVLRYFEMQLLTGAGYRPELRNCVVCHHSLEPETNYFCLKTGGLACPGCAVSEPFSYPLSVNAQKVLRLFQDDSYATARRLRLRGELNREIEQTMADYFKYLLERDVKSAMWLRELRQQIDNLGPGTADQP